MEKKTSQANLSVCLHWQQTLRELAHRCGMWNVECGIRKSVKVVFSIIRFGAELRRTDY